MISKETRKKYTYRMNIIIVRDHIANFKCYNKMILGGENGRKNAFCYNTCIQC